LPSLELPMLSPVSIVVSGSVVTWKGALSQKPTFLVMQFC